MLWEKGGTLIYSLTRIAHIEGEVRPPKEIWGSITFGKGEVNKNNKCLLQDVKGLKMNDLI